MIASAPGVAWLFSTWTHCLFLIQLPVYHMPLIYKLLVAVSLKRIKVLRSPLGDFTSFIFSFYPLRYQSNIAVSREMSSLKSQIQELKNMMRMSFDLQLDIQRAIRQEVAAAVSQATSGKCNVYTATTMYFRIMQIQYNILQDTMRFKTHLL